MHPNRALGMCSPRARLATILGVDCPRDPCVISFVVQWFRCCMCKDCLVYGRDSTTEQRLRMDVNKSADCAINSLAHLPGHSPIRVAYRYSQGTTWTNMIDKDDCVCGVCTTEVATGHGESDALHKVAAFMTMVRAKTGSDAAMDRWRNSMVGCISDQAHFIAIACVYEAMNSVDVHEFNHVICMSVQLCDVCKGN